MKRETRHVEWQVSRRDEDAARAPIQIKGHDVRTSIWNPGRLPEHGTPEKLMRPHSSRPFNPEIAGAFFRSGEIEMWDRGIERFFEECRAAGFPDPAINHVAGGWCTEFPYPKTVLDRLSGGPAPSGETFRGRSWARPLGRWSSSCLQSPESRFPRPPRRFSDLSGLSSCKTNTLKDGGIIRRIGPDQGGRWEVKQ